MIIGEVPGNEEDLQGRPFMGPAGRLLREVLEKVGLDARNVYLTNVVKHFKFEPRGKHRLHKKPNAMEMSACRPWLDAELQALRPQVIICLGATASQALLGRAFRVSQQRGKNVSSPLAPFVLATVHPSSILRIPEQALRRQAREEFIADLRVAARAIARVS
jgi:DNA polymerase